MLGIKVSKIDQLTAYAFSRPYLKCLLIHHRIDNSIKTLDIRGTLRLMQIFLYTSRNSRASPLSKPLPETRPQIYHDNSLHIFLGQLTHADSVILAIVSTVGCLRHGDTYSLVGDRWWSHRDTSFLKLFSRGVILICVTLSIAPPIGPRSFKESSASSPYVCSASSPL